MNIYSRRDLLKGLAATGLGAMALGRRLFGQQPAHGRIDVHHHYRLPGMKLLVPDDGWTPARSVEQMYSRHAGPSARAVTSLLVNGTSTRFPEIRFIVSHSGAAVPTLAGRIQDRIPKDRTAILPKGALYELQRLYYEVAHATYPWPMAALANFVPRSHILFGTDYFFEPIETTLGQIPNSAIPSETWQLIYRTNAEQLFPRLKV